MKNLLLHIQSCGYAAGFPQSVVVGKEDQGTGLDRFDLKRDGRQLWDVVVGRGKTEGP